MKKLSKSEMKKLLGGDGSSRATCGGNCYYFSGGLLKVSTCVYRIYFPPAPPVVLPPSCICQATGNACGGSGPIEV